MKKVILYLIFLGLLFSNSQTHAVASSQNAMVKITIHKTHDGKALNKKGSLSHKTYLLNDYEDCDDYDCDDNDTFIKDKFYYINILSFNSNQLTADYSSKTFCDKIYNHVNFSRLPRFNYISLRVIRL